MSYKPLREDLRVYRTNTSSSPPTKANNFVFPIKEQQLCHMLKTNRQIIKKLWMIKIIPSKHLRHTKEFTNTTVLQYHNMIWWLCSEVTMPMSWTYCHPSKRFLYTRYGFKKLFSLTYYCS